MLGAVPRSVRSFLSLCLLVGCLWFAFAVPLGGQTMAEHADAIGRTPEAKALLEGAREAINPALVEARDRVLGEHVEAPTYLPPGTEVELPGSNTPDEAIYADIHPQGPHGEGPSSADAPRLPGRR